MKILVSNDDGINSQGLRSLVTELQKVAQVIVVAPDREQSGISSAITLHQPVRLRELASPLAGVKTYAVEGSPADSVILALEMLAKDVRLVFSGINEGTNLGNDVFLSGTVGAALQGYFRGLTSVVLSIALGENMHFETAAKVGRLIAQKIISQPPPQTILLNINLPNLPQEEIKGVEITRLGQRDYTESVQEGFDGRRKYYWIVRGKPRWTQDNEGTDIWAVKNGKLSLTSLDSRLEDGGEWLNNLAASLSQMMFG